MFDGDGFWWTKDTAGHANVKSRVYEKKGNKLEWLFDADEFGNKITNKHKGEVGKSIPMNTLHGVNK